MSLKVTINEEPRVFTVMVGSNEVGKVTSYCEKGEDNDEAYEAERYVGVDDDDESVYETIGYYESLKDAGVAVIDYAHGEGKIDKITERLV